ncbi:DUF4870 domain-containing protein [Pseudonocardia abyssalis]|uniref:DUF4870 domain-containing protein n=2 Tax=Pseudonocardia abyssalis TaxID=2792008 RepID=A0ABS6UXW1_9PSEU|nr:DUF4870 domain-containing protein [Pseudonocardia abyssalis]MBW0137064.1 DUF4870 domain-containing protein [Pseudonocardia abyssalis]
MSSYPPPGSSWPQGSGSGELVPSEDRNWAVGAHIGSFVAAYVALGLIAPLIVLLVRGGQSPFVRRQAVESLNFQLNALVIIAVGWLLAIVLIGFAILAVYGVFYVICVVLATIKASQGEDFRYPLTVRLIS